MVIIIKQNLCIVIPQTNQGNSVIFLDQSGSAFVGGLPVEARLEWSKVE